MTGWQTTITVNQLNEDERALLGGLAAGDALDNAAITAHAGNWRHAHASLARFGLSRTTWNKERNNWVDEITDAGRAAFADIRLHEIYKPCCERAVMLNCVCRYKSRCFAGHPGNGCHGSHD